MHFVIRRPLLFFISGSIAVGVAWPPFAAGLWRWWGISVEEQLPGAMSLFLVPYVASAGLFLMFLGFSPKAMTWSQRVTGVVVLLVAPIIGILLSLPVVCLVAQECL